MSNDFSTLKTVGATKKIILARLRPAREISYQLELDSGTLYKMTFPFDSLCRIEVNGVSYTKVAGTPSAFEYSFDSTTRELKIELGDNITMFQSVGGIVAFYYLFYTNDYGRYISEDPEDDTTPVRYWDSRIEGFPEFSITQNDIIDGFFTIGNSSLTLVNDDNDFNKYVTVNDSLSMKEIKIWQCLDDISNIKKFFFGTCSSVSIDRRVEISTDNIFGAFDNIYRPISGIFDLSYGGSGFNFTVSNQNADNNILKLFCLASKTVVKVGTGAGSAGRILLGAPIGNFPIYDAYTAVNVSYDTTRFRTTNRTWAICIESDTSSDHTEAVSGLTGSFPSYRITVQDANLYRPHDQISIDGQYNVWVSDIDYDNNHLYLFDDNDSDNSFSDGDTIVRPSVSLLYIHAYDQDSISYYAALRWGTDYTISTIDGVRCIVLADNFEINTKWEPIFAEHPIADEGIAPDNVIYFRAWNHDSTNHEDVVAHFIESQGLSIDSASITNTGLVSMKTNFTLPLWGQSKYPTTKDALEKLLTSTCGYLTINNNFEIGYQLLNAPSPTESIDSDHMMLGSFSQNIDYKDVYSKIEFINEHEESIQWSSSYSDDIIDQGRASVFKDKAYLLHGISRTKTIEHLLLDPTNSKDRIAGLLSNRRLSIGLTTKGANFESIIGDEFTIETDKVVGTEGEVDGKILSINKRANETTITVTDLLGL